MQSSRLLRSALHASLLVVVGVLLAVALAGDRGRLAILQVESVQAGLQEQIRVLEADNRELALDLAQLRRPRFAAEKLARETFGLLRPDEVVFLDAPQDRTLQK